jgi:hypothetical protein
MANRETRTFVLGLLAGGVALIVAAAFRIIAGGLFVPELASQTVFSLTPGQIESSSVATLGSLAKYTAFTTAIIINLVLYGGLAIFLHKLYSKLSGKNTIVNLVQLSFIPYLVMVAISAILLQLSELLAGSSEIQYAFLFLLLPNVAYGRTLLYLFQRGAATIPPKGVKPRNALNAEINSKSGQRGEKNFELSGDSSVRRVSRKQFITMAAATIGVAIFIFWARTFPFHSKPSMPVQSKGTPATTFSSYSCRQYICSGDSCSICSL